MTLKTLKTQIDRLVKAGHGDTEVLCCYGSEYNPDPVYYNLAGLEGTSADNLGDFCAGGDSVILLNLCGA